MKLTDIMFNMEYLAMNVGATWKRKGDVFMDTQVKANSSGDVTLAYTPVPVQTGGTAYLYYKEVGDSIGEYKKIAATGTSVELGSSYANKDLCISYRYTANYADQIVIDAQYIPDTVHAILTVALYAGDACNVGTTTNKIGSVVIDIPRFQLSGATDLSMTAGGTSTNSLDGKARATCF